MELIPLQQCGIIADLKFDSSLPITQRKMETVALDRRHNPLVPLKLKYLEHIKWKIILNVHPHPNKQSTQALRGLLKDQLLIHLSEAPAFRSKELQRLFTLVAPWCPPKSWVATFQHLLTNLVAFPMLHPMFLQIAPRIHWAPQFTEAFQSKPLNRYRHLFSGPDLPLPKLHPRTTYRRPHSHRRRDTPHISSSSHRRSDARGKPSSSPTKQHRRHTPSSTLPGPIEKPQRTSASTSSHRPSDLPPIQTKAIPHRPPSPRPVFSPMSVATDIELDFLLDQAAALDHPFPSLDLVDSLDLGQNLPPLE